MAFAREAGTAVILVLFTLYMHSAGMAALIAWARNVLRSDLYKLGQFRTAVLMLRFSLAILVLHFLEILLWAASFRWLCFPDWESAFYFSSVSYTTVGYGDVVLLRSWRALGPVESIMGILMCGFSVSFLFAIVTRLADYKTRHSS
jgi:voltage-gated potassium channel